MELLRRFARADYDRALVDWAWLGHDLDALTPRWATAFGDLFLEGPDGAFWFLDTVEGRLTRLWDMGQDLQAALDTPDGQDRFLLATLVDAATSLGLRPSADQVLTFTLPPIVGGGFSVDNVAVVSFVVALSISGQLHRQVKDLPPGTPISGFQMAD